MTTTPETSTGVLVPVADPLFTLGERQALAEFLAGYTGLARDAYTRDVRQYMSWCALSGLHLFAAKGADIEGFRADMKTRVRARATIARRLRCTTSRRSGHLVFDCPLWTFCQLAVIQLARPPGARRAPDTRRVSPRRARHTIRRRASGC
jgi:hypothetical protein